MIPSVSSLPSGSVPDPAAARDLTPERLKQAAEEFEAILLGQVLKGLRRTIPEDEDTPAARQMYNELFDEIVATDVAHKRGIGLADVIRSYVERSGASRGARR